MIDITAIQEQLRAQGVDGWLFYDHHKRDPIAYRVLGLEADDHSRGAGTAGFRARANQRGWCIASGSGWTRCRGELLYSGWREQRSLEGVLARAHRVAMQYSPDCMIPYISLVDGGAIT